MDLFKNVFLMISIYLIGLSNIYAQPQPQESHPQKETLQERPKLNLEAIEAPLLNAITNNFGWPTSFSHLSFYDENALPRPVNCPRGHQGFECITDIGSEWIARVHYNISNFIGSTPEICSLSFFVLYDSERGIAKSLLIYDIICGHEFVKDKEGFIWLTEEHFIQ